jgi:rhodanese-related sulfurtransferase
LRRSLFELVVIVLIAALAGVAIHALRRDRLPMRLPDAYYEVGSKAKPIFLDAARSLFEGGHAAFVDARPADAYIEGQIEGAFSLPLDRWQEIYPGLSGWIVGHRIVVYAGKDGIRDADDLARALASRKVSDSLYIYIGGFEEWKAAGLPLREGPDPTLGDGDEGTGGEPADSMEESR